MFRIAALFVLLTMTVPATAEHHDIKGEQDGVSFDYTAKLDSNRNLILRGTYTNTGEPFLFTVNPVGHVDGWVGENPVSFDVARKLRDRAVAELGASDDLALVDSAVAR